jgi:predicted nucleic acid-binding protein
MNNIFQNISRLYLDTNIFIYFLEAHETYVEAVAEVFKLCETYDIVIFTSEITITECLVHPYRQNNAALIEQYEAFFLSAENTIGLVPVESSILRDTPKTIAASRLKLVDGIHLTTALALGCNGFLTNDKNITSTSESMPVIYLSDLMSK